MYLKQKRKTIFITSVLLLTCLILLISASYAWISMSRAPEIIGIETNIGSNGSLEIALLSDTTYMDPTLIKSMVGTSTIVQEPMIANLYWGNIIELNNSSYGLGEISLKPSRLDVSIGRDNKNVVGSSILLTPKYEKDGRTSSFSSDSVSAVYDGEDFSYVSYMQRYGVRGIGAINNMTSQQIALAGARSAVKAYSSGAANTMTSVWKVNGAALLNIFEKHYIKQNNDFNNTDIAVLRSTAEGILEALNYIDSALRQGIIGYVASVIEDTETFNLLRSYVGNTAVPLSLILNNSPTKLPAEFSNWVTQIEQGKSDMQSVIRECNAMQESKYSWQQVEPVLCKIVLENNVYFNDNLLSKWNTNTNLKVDNSLLLTQGSGMMATIADYAGNYNVFLEYEKDINIEVKTASMISPSYLQQISERLEECQAASGNETSIKDKLHDIYGYAIDIAFRCNTESDLLLQIMPLQRIDKEAEHLQTQGAGCYMRFISQELDQERMLSLMRGIRVGFLDNQNTLLGIARLDTVSYKENEDGLTAPLYLYEYYVASNGGILMTEPKDESYPITSLEQNIAKTITVVVWLDGDYVDNTLAANITKSITGTLNLQFASSKDLVSVEQLLDIDE